MTEFLHGGSGRTGEVKRKQRMVRMSDSEWDAISAEAEALGVGVSECIRLRFGQREDGPDGVLGGGIPDAVVVEALVDAIHMHELIGRQYEDADRKSQFDGTLDEVRKRHSPAVHEELVPELMVREAMVAMIHLHLLARESHEGSGKLSAFEETRDGIKARLRPGPRFGRGGR